MLWCLSSKTLCILIYDDGVGSLQNCIFARQLTSICVLPMGHTAGGEWRDLLLTLLPVGFLSEGRDQEGVLAEVISELDKDGKEFIGWLWPSPQPCFFTLASVKPPHSSSWSQFAIFLTQNWLLYIQSEMSAPTQQWSLFSGLSFSSWHPSTEPLNFNNSDLFPLWSPIPRVIAAYCSCYLCYTL